MCCCEMATNIRAFTQKLSKQHAADVRKNVSTYTSKSCLVSPSSLNWSSEVVEPFDYEEFISQYQILIERDPLKAILDIPPNDVEINVIERPIRTVQHIIPEDDVDTLLPHVQTCIRCYTSDWKIVKYQSRNFSSTIGPRVNVLQQKNACVKQDFEDDYQGIPSDSTSEIDVQSMSSSERQSVVSMASLSSCGDTLTPRNSWASLDLRHSAGDPLIPEILDHVSTESLDHLNETRRQVDRQEALFSLCPINEDVTEPIERRLPPLPPSEHIGHRIIVKCLKLTFDLEVEPLFASMALYDAKERKKVSETFYFDLNPEFLKRMLGDHVPYSDTSTLARECIFDVSYPSSDLFIVIRLEKVLQGDINDCIEPYLKDVKLDEKSREKLKINAVSVCERLGKYRQPFAWTAVSLMNVIDDVNSTERENSDREASFGSGTTNSLDRKSSSSGLEQLRKRASDMGTLTRRGSLERRSEKRRSWSPDHLANSLDNFRVINLNISPLFKLEPEKMKDEDLYKCLLEFKKPNLIFKKLKCIPATLKLEIAPMPVDVKNCLTPELVKIHPFYEESQTRPIKEILEFPVKELHTPHYVYRNLLYVNPKELNFSNRTGSARNLSVRVQLMAGEGEACALNNIFGKSSCPEMTNEAYTAVTYHNKCPTFYDEIKIKLPAALEDKHHLLFTFYHISCQRKLEQPNVETPVGYTWLPLLRDGRLVSGEFCLPIILDQPHPSYSYLSADVYLPQIRWFDNHKGLFTVVLDTTSSIHTRDPPIERFFTAYDYVYSGSIPPRIGEAGVEAELRESMLRLENAKSEAIIRNLTVVLDCIIQLLVQPPKVSGHVLNVRSSGFETLCLLLDKLTNTPNLQKDSHGRDSLLATYIHYQCHLPHPLSDDLASNYDSPSIIRAVSNPDMEVAHYNARGLDRATSMRTANSEHVSVSPCQRIIHQELISYWVIADGRSKELSMQNAWFLFELIVKSMVEHLDYTKTFDAPRKLRFPEQLLDDIVVLLQSVISEIISYSAEDIRKARKLNDALAFFIFDLFMICDRGFVMQLIRLYMKQIQAKISSIHDTMNLVELKLEFIRIVCSHEHYVPLNLPFATPFMSPGGSVSPSPSVTSSTSQNSFLSGAPASQDRASTFAELTTEYKQHHYLSGLVLTDLATVLCKTTQSYLHHKAVDVLRCLMYWHDTDPRYSCAETKKRVAALYLPLLNIAMDVLPLMQCLGADKDKYIFDESSSANSQISHTVAQAIAGTIPTSYDTIRRASINAEVTKNLLTCVLWVLKNVDQESLSQWLGELNSPRLATMLQMLDACTNCFEYKPHKKTMQTVGYTQPPVDVKSKLEDIILGQGSAREMMQKRKNMQQHGTSEKLRWRKEQMAYRSGGESSDKVKENVMADTHFEGILATEASFIILDTLERCVSTIAQWDSQQNLIGLALTVLLHALGKNQSITVLPHIFASQRTLVYKFHSALFDDESNHCAKLCLLLLKHCGSNLASVRSQAAASLYLLMRQTFQIGNNFARVKMQVTMSLSKLVGTSSSFNDDSLRRSLKTILEYGERDTELMDTSFPEQVRDLIFNLHMILSDTVKMKEFQEDPEMLLDLMYRIAKGYQNSPDLRLTWLDSMAQKHKARGNYCEAGMCCIHSAALVAEYLAMLEPLPHLPVGAATLEKVSPNVLDESAVSDDVLSPEREDGCLGFTEGRLMKLLEQAAVHLYAGAMYEPMNDIYSVLIPIAEHNRDYKKLAYIHGKLHDAYTKIDQLHGKRLFGTYFRVGFYGSKFGDLDGEEFIYKEPNLTKLPEIFSRLENFYAERFGHENIVIIKDSNSVDSSALDSNKAYLQITYVEPYFEPYELRHRPSHFDRNYNIKKFMYATPFTTTGRPHGELHEQYKRKTILTTAVHFPYVKTRIQVVNRTQIVLTPIEVAIEDIQKKTAELAAATQQDPADPKILQMVLQGCIGTTVNQGPLEMAMTFLPCDGKPLTALQNKLRLCFKDFSKRCSDALKKNRTLIGADQKDYQKELDKNYRHFTEKLQPLVNPQNITVLSSSPSKYRNGDSGLLRW